MAKRAGLPWDAILGAEVAQAYKPDPQAYLRTAEVLGIRPDELCLVAAHNGDLRAARAAGLATAFVLRPGEQARGRRPTPAPRTPGTSSPATSRTSPTSSGSEAGPRRDSAPAGGADPAAGGQGSGATGPGAIALIPAGNSGPP